jgi:small-conductance mechanosensitive channel
MYIQFPLPFSWNLQRNVFFICLFSVLLLIPGLSSGKDQGDKNPETELEKDQASPVVIEGHTLFYVRGNPSFPSLQRAAGITERLEKIMGNYSIPPDSVKLYSVADHQDVYAGSSFIMKVYDSDAGPEHISSLTYAEFIQKQIRSEIINYRHERSSPVLLRKAIKAIVAAVFLVVILFVISWLLKKLHVIIQNRIKSRFDVLENRSHNLIRSKQLWAALRLLISTLRIALIVIIIAGFVQYILGLFPWTNGIAAYTLRIFLDPLITMGHAFLGYLPSMAFLIVIFFVTRYLLKLLSLLSKGLQNGSIVIRNFDSDWSMPMFKMLRIGIVAFAVIIAYPYIPGSDSNAFKGITVFLGILFSLGSSSFIGNIIAGYTMAFRRAFRKGDLIMVNNQMGFVEEQKLMVTRLRTIKNEEIVIPNSSLLSNDIINYSKKAGESGLILHSSVGIGYETPWRLVESMLLQAADRTEGLMKQPPPFVIQKSMGNFAVEYEINVYCNDVSNLPQTYTNLHRNILDVFNENNVQIMTPAYMGDPETPKIVPRDHWYTPATK